MTSLPGPWPVSHALWAELHKHKRLLNFNLIYLHTNRGKLPFCEGVNAAFK